MKTRVKLWLQWVMLTFVASLTWGILPSDRVRHAATAQEKTTATKPIERGLRVYSAGHSFHYFVPPILGEMVREAGIKDHVQVGLSALGGSRVIQHWDLADDKFKAKENLRSGKVDVLTLSPIHLPDEGIEKFAQLGLEHNPDIRVTVEQIWMPFDIYDPSFKLRPAKVDHNAMTVEELRKIHATPFKLMDEHIANLNQKFGKPVLYVVPAGQAVVALREKVMAGEVPGIKTQTELFTDPLAHAAPPLEALVVYCHYAVIYRRSPVGLPIPSNITRRKNPNWDEKLNRLLQEVAWKAVLDHPLSGVKTDLPGKKPD